MEKKDLSPVALTLALAGVGAGLATLAGLPAAALLGSTVLVTLAALAGATLAMPALLRNLGFAVIGGTLGAGVTPSFLSDVAHYPVSLAALTVSMAVTMVLSSLVLRQMFAIDRPTAALSTAPGALTYALALAAEGKGDVRVVTVLQSVRLLLITLLLPPILALTGGASDPATARLPLAILPSLALVLLSMLLGAGLERLRTPAAWLIGGLVVSGLAHGLGMVEGNFSSPVLFFGFAIAGGVIGLRFQSVTRGDLIGLGKASLAATAIGVGVSAAAAAILSRTGDLPFAQVWIAFAPGGVEGMSAMALALGHDPIFVATHHVFRILLLIVVLPLLVRG